MDRILRRLFTGTLLIVGAAVVFAGGAGESGADNGELTYPYKVATTVGMVTDIVRNVAGEKAQVQGIIGEGVDPHLFTPTRSDVQTLLDADIVFYVGLLLEGKMTDTLVRVATQGKPVYPVTDLLDQQYLLEPPEFQGHPDPHVWMDAEAWGKAVEAVAQTLGAFDPANADVYRSNAAEYLTQIAELHRYAQTMIVSIPEQQRVLVTAHDAFNYFGRAYGIEVRGIQGISTESEAGLQDINRLVDFLVERNVQAVFVETSVADKNVRALIEGAAAQGHRVRIGGELYSDAMGEPGTYTGTYIGMIDHNVTTITRALGGAAPEGGLNGALGAH